MSRPEDSYTAFHWGRLPDGDIEIERPSARGKLWALGQVVQINYLSDKNDGLTEYYHRFDDELPLLVCDSEGRLFLAGGDYIITEDGIEG